MIEQEGSALSLLIALNRLEAELPLLVGEEHWGEIRPKLENVLDRLREATSLSQREDLADELVELIQNFPQLLARVKLEQRFSTLVSLDLEDRLRQQFPSMVGNSIELLSYMPYAMYWSPMIKDVGELENDSSRHVQIPEGGVGGAKSLRLRNLWKDFRFDFGKLAQLLGGTLLVVQDNIDRTSTLLVAAGVLLTLSSLYDMATDEINEEEARVLWALIQAHDRKTKQATLDAIVDADRIAWRRYGTGSSDLSKEEIQAALLRLQKYHCVQQIDTIGDSWQLVDTHVVVR